MLTKFELKTVISNISYMDWNIKLLYDDERPYLQIFGHSPDPHNNMEDAEWSSRKWFLSPHMCRNEVVRTAYKAIQTANLHELDENFRYKGVLIHNPHIDYDQLSAVLKGGKMIDVRDDGMFVK